MAQFFHKTMVLAGLATLAVLLGLPPGTAQAQSGPAPEREQLLNGLTILYSNRPGDPHVLLKLRIKSGAVFDLAGKAGSMALLADAMFPESSTREYVAEELGGRLDVTTTYDSIDVTLSGKSSELERIIELIRNAVVNVNLSAESVATLREARLKQLAERSSKAGLADRADRAVAARLFGSYPYGSPPQGTAETVAKIERADLMLARERFLNAENATLVVVGGVEKPRLMRALRQLLGPWQKGDRIVPATFRQPGTVDDRVLLIDAPAATNVEVRLAVRGLSRSDADVMTASVLARIARNRWQAQVPELASSAFVRNETYALGGMLVFSASVPPASAAKAIAAAKSVMMGLTEADPTQAEIVSAVGPGLMLSHRPSPDEALADAWLDTETYKLSSTKPVDAIRIPPADIRRTAARLFGNSAPLAIVTLGNAAELQSQLGYKIELRSNAPEAKPATNPAPSPKKP
jgi:predicted Zn-dependent peptidase